MNIIFKNSTKAFIFALLTTLSLIGNHSLYAKPIKPPDRKIFQKIDRWLDRWRKTNAGRAFNRFFFQTGLYHAFWWRRDPRVFNRVFATSELPEFKIITANLMLFPPPLADSQAEKIRLFAEVVRRYNPDLIFVQEVWDNHSIIVLADEFSDYNLTFSPASVYNRSGLVLFSRPRIISSDFIMYPVQIHHNLEELLAQKGALIVNIRNGMEVYSLINTHLYSAPLTTRYRPNPRQFKFLLDYMKSKSKFNTILAGDLNLRPEEVRKIAKTGFVIDSCQLPTAGTPKRTQKLDHILLLSQYGAELISHRVSGKIDFSDHSPVFGICNFK